MEGTGSGSSSLGKKVYLAAKFEMRPVLRIVSRDLERLGYEVVSDWVNRSEELLPMRTLAIEDLKGVDRSDLFILDTTFPGGSGREVELGYALAREKQVWMVGPIVNLFHYHPYVRRFNTWTDVLDELEKQAREI